MNHQGKCCARRRSAGKGPIESLVRVRDVSFATKWAVRAMSGLPLVATEPRTSLEVRFVPGPVMRSRRGPADDCFLSVKRGPQPQGRRTEAKRTEEGCLTAEKSSARQESCKPKSTAPR